MRSTTRKTNYRYSELTFQNDYMFHVKLCHNYHFAKLYCVASDLLIFKKQRCPTLDPLVLVASTGNIDVGHHTIPLGTCINR